MTDRLLPPELDWTEAGPVSRRFGDVYFSAEDGLAETRAVFLAGCGLPEAWARRDRFVLAETGFGTGLNILAVLDLWRRTRGPDARLHLFSVEAHPLTRDQAARAHAAWPELAEVSQALLAQWPEPSPGFHRLELPRWGATLDLGHGEAAAMLSSWLGRADAWFLDGFAPAANAEMWRDEVLDLVAARSAPGARLASFTVAGAVRRGLAARGFTVEKRPGHGRKRERLEAVFPGVARGAGGAGRTLVIGAGIGGAAVARAFQRLGASTRVLEAEAPGAGASGFPAGLVTPRLDAGGGDVAALSAQALLRAVDLYRREAPEAVVAQGVLRLARDARDAARLDLVSHQPWWPAGGFVPLDAEEASHRLGEPTTRPGLWMGPALAIEPRVVVLDWLAETETVQGRVRVVHPGSPARAELDDGRVLEAEAVVLAAGWGSRALGLDALRPVRGQVAWTRDAPGAMAAVWGAGYVVPMKRGLLFGATHDRGMTDSEVSQTDQRRCLDALAGGRPVLAERLRNGDLQGRAAVRAVTADHLPLCGRVAEGVWTLSGFGGRGFAWAPLLAEHLAAEIQEAPSPLPGQLAARLDPVRASLSGT